MNREDEFRIEIFADFDENNIKEAPTARGFIFKIPRIIMQNTFFTDDGRPNKQGVLLMQKLMVESLAAVVHNADANGYYSKKEFLKETIEYLEHLSDGKIGMISGFGEEPEHNSPE